MRDEPSGAFWDKVDASDLNEGGSSLKDTRNSPAPAVGDLKSPIGNPRSDDGTQILSSS